MDRQRRELLDEAARFYIGTDQFDRHFARNKLRYDPVFFALLERGGLPARGTLVDVGCGQGLMLALLAAARERFRSGEWPSDWSAPPAELLLTGIERHARRARAAQGALQGRARIVLGDVRDAPIPPCDAVLLIDVLFYLDEDEQLHLLRRIATALAPGGLLVLREADAGAGFAFRLTSGCERLLEALRGRPGTRLHYRKTTEWSQMLRDLGFAVDAVPMSAGTPFANVLLYGRKSVH